ASAVPIMNMTAGSTVPAIITAMIATVISPLTHTSHGRPVGPARRVGPASDRGSTGVKLASDGASIELRPGSDTTPAGVRPGSDHFCSGFAVRTWELGCQTGVRPSSDPCLTLV